MTPDASKIASWIEPLARRSGQIADVFFETRREASFELVDGRLAAVRAARVSGCAARLSEEGHETLAFTGRSDEAGVRECVRTLQIALGKDPLPARPAPRSTEDEGRDSPELERWSRRRTAVTARHAPRHRIRWSLRETARRVVPAKGGEASFTRRLVSIEGTVVAASRRGDETRRFDFHAPNADSTADEMRAALTHAVAPREAMVPCGQGSMDVLLAEGCAAVLFHEILAHPLEAGETSPLEGLEQARLAVPELEVRDDPTRLDLFGGYERDDEGVKPKPVKLLDAGRLAGRLYDRAHDPRGASNESGNGRGRRASASDPPLPRSSNVVVAAGHATADEMARRLGNGLWISELHSGSIELASGRFRLRFPRARRVRRGRLADECGPGTLSGDILSTLKAIEPGVGREVRPYRRLGWCSRSGQLVPVQGAAPDILVRGVAIRPAE